VCRRRRRLVGARQDPQGGRRRLVV
jgi:hypothetical protein